MPLDSMQIFKARIKQVAIAAYLAKKPTTPKFTVKVEGQDVQLEPDTPEATTVDEDLIEAIAEGVATAVLEAFAKAEVFFPLPGLKAIIPPGVTGEVQGTGRLQ